MTNPTDLPDRSLTISLGHNHVIREVKPVGQCKRCDYVRGLYALTGEQR